jgi:hypothetical protein
LSVCFGVATSLATDGLAAAARLLDEDDDITSSASLDFMLSLLFAELDLTGYVERIRSTLDRHGANIVVCDLLKAIAMTKYLSPYTRANDVTELEAFLLDAVAPLAPASGRRRGSNAVQGRSEARSRLQTRLRQARIRLQAQPVGDDLVDELLELDASTSD